jgi:enoyl-CoA hydratase/carnithine racemase
MPKRERGKAMSKLLYRKRNRIAYLTLNRPEAKNAIDPEMHQLLWDAWEDFDGDDNLDVAVLTGTGDAFSAGADLKTYIPFWMGADARRVRDNVATGIGGITRGLHRIYKPVIAAVNGWALAAGLELALACDIRVASERAQFGSFEARRGYHHGDGGIVRLVNTCGVGVALEMLLTAEPISAGRALQCNLVARVVPHEDLMEAAETIAGHILRNDQAAIRSAKETIFDVVGRSLDDQLRVEAVNGYSSPGPDTAERLRQFYEKTDDGRVGLSATPPPPQS